MNQIRPLLILSTGALIAAIALPARASDKGLVGYWKLHGDCRDYSGNENHGRNHGVDIDTGTFDGRGSYLVVPDTENLNFSDRDFSIAAEVYTAAELTDFLGDIVSKYDPAIRRGFHLSLNGNSSGYNAQSDSRQLVFGIDQNDAGSWSDYGRPGGKTHISDALTVFNGELYAGTTDGATEEEWAHVYRYRDGQGWTDCGRVGNDRTRGVYAMIVHNGDLYAATSASHGPQNSDMAYGRVYRYTGATNWQDIGQPGKYYRLNSLASYNGNLYVTAFNIGPDPGHVYVYEGNHQWRNCGQFDGWPHPLVVHDGRLFTAYPQGEVFAYDGNTWENLGSPLGSLDECNQIHSMGVYRGELYVGIWPSGKVAVLRDARWSDLGKLSDATEVVGLAAYNGQLFAGTIPRAELLRFDGPGKWTSIRRLFDPMDFNPVPVGSGAKEVQDWTRASSLAIYGGKLFVTTATCYRTKIDDPLPDDIRGNVYAFKTGACASFDENLGAGWKHVAAVRRDNTLELYVDGQLVASASIDKPINVTTSSPIQIGAGPQGHFHGKLREVRLYDRAISDSEITGLYKGSASTLSAAAE
jgi:hypothetical protein